MKDFKWVIIEDSTTGILHCESIVLDGVESLGFDLGDRTDLGRSNSWKWI